MAKLSKDLSAGALHPRETLFASGALALVNSEIALPVDGCATIIFDIRGTFNLEFIVEASVDNVNWQAIAIRPVNGFPSYALRVSGSTPGTWTGSIAGFRFARARCSGFTSGDHICRHDIGGGWRSNDPHPERAAHGPAPLSHLSVDQPICLGGADCRGNASDNHHQQFARCLGLHTGCRCAATGPA
jgi:hypothetical protein